MRYDLLNRIPVKPRWHDKHLLPAVKKFVPGYNILTIDYKGYGQKYIVSQKQAKTYPTQTVHSKFYGDYEVYDIPWGDLSTIQEFEQSYQDIKSNVKELGW